MYSIQRYGPFIIAFLLTIYIDLNAQDGAKIWQKIYDTNNEGSFEGVIVDSKGDVVMVGEWEPSSDRQLIIQKLKPNGTLVWQKIYHEPGVDIDAYYLKEGTQNTYHLLATANANSIMYKFNSDGSIASTKKVIPTMEISDFKIEPDGTYFFCGVKSDKPFIGKYNADLNSIWEKNIAYSFPSGTSGGPILSFAKTADGGFYLLSTGVGLKSQYSQADAIVSKVDKSGNILWVKAYGGTNHEELTDGGSTSSRSEIIATRDGGFAFAIYSLSKDLDIQETSSQRGIWVVKADAKGIIQWAKKPGADEAGGGGSPSGIREKADGSLMVFGRGGSTAYCSIDKGLVAWIIELSRANGGILSRKCFGNTESDGVRSLFLANNTAYAVGFYDNDAWVFSYKIDNTTPVAELNTSKQINVKLYPIPAVDHITVDFEGKKYTNLVISMSNILGQKIWNKKMGDGMFYTETIVFPEVPPGHFFINLTYYGGHMSKPITIVK